MHTAPYFTAIGLIAVVYSVRVVKLRRLHQVSLGDGGVPALNQAIRAFGNLVEYSTLGLVMLMALEYIQAPVWFLHVCGFTLVAGRMLHALAFSKPKIVMQTRVAGMMLTYFSLTTSAVGITVFSMMSI